MKTMKKIFTVFSFALILFFAGCAQDENTTEETGSPQPVCGNSVVETGEACDDGNASNDDHCLNDCQLASCGDGYVQTGVEACDDGNIVAETSCPYGTASCSTCNADCSAEITGLSGEYCGDSITNGTETCDDGNATTESCVYGESSCTVCDSTCNSVAGAVTGYCGDATTNGTEACDDGNTSETDGCMNDCSLPTCGDSITNGAEECDDGKNGNNTDGCLDTCLLAACGDGFVRDMYELCDDGNTLTELACPYGTASCTACNADCSAEITGLTGKYCGDSNVDSGNGETCDDGNATTETCTYGEASCTVCDSTCTSVAGAVVGFCGNSTTDTAYGETCDDGGTENNDGCSSTCKIEVCGDAITQTNEECDDGNTNNTDGCTDTCLSGSIGTQASPKILWGTPITGLQTTSQIAGGTGVYESYYQVSIDGEGAVILLENALVDVDLYVYSDAAFSTLECSDTSANLNKACKEFAATPGIHTVYIKIVSPTSVSTTFHMTIRGQDVVTANDVAKAISFPQTLPTTGKIKAGTGSVTSSYLISGLTPGNHYNVRLEGETGEVRLEMKLTDIYCQKNWVDYFNPVSCDFQAQASGEMYAYVRSYIGDSISYKLIVTESTPVDLTVNIDNIVSDHISATIFYTITNNGTADVYPDKDVYMWLDAASAPGYADGASSAAFETVVEMIPAGSSMSRVYTVNAKDLNLNSGTAYVLVDMNNTVYETDDANNTSASFAWDNGLSWPPTATPLVLDAPFVSGNIDTEGGIAWYSFDKLKMNGYQLYLDELDTTGTSQTGDVQVTAVLSSLSGVSAYQIGKIGLSNTNDAATVLTWFSSTTTDSTNGTVYLAVKGDTYNDTGSFLIKMLNHIKFPPDASTALTVNPAFFSWINVPDYGYVWASFDVTSGTDYTVLWDDCSTGSACTQLNWQEAVLNLFYPDTTAISGTLWGGGSTGYSFTANQNSTVYIRLQSNAGKTGLVGVKVTSP